MMTDYDDEYNARMELAWEEWQQLCAVDRCSGEHSALLRKEISSAFYKKMEIFTNYQWPPPSPKEIVHKFDTAIIEKAEFPGKDKRYKSETERQKKDFKKDIWEKKRQSQDPPLRVIRGMLLGGEDNRCTILWETIKKYLLDEHGFVVVNENGKPRLRPQRSIDEKIVNEEGDPKTFGEYVEGLTTPPRKLEAEKNELLKAVTGRFSNEEVAVLLAKSANISLASQVLLDYLGLGHSQAYALFKTAGEKLSSIIDDFCEQDNDRMDALHLIRTRILIPQLKAEKNAEEFLMELEDQTNQEIN